MYQAIHYDDHGPMTDPCRYLRRHDLVYRRPRFGPMTACRSEPATRAGFCTRPPTVWS